MSVFTPEMTIVGLLPGNIAPSLNEKETCLWKMIELLHNEGHILEKQSVYDKLMGREMDMSTGIGNQIAIPHVRHEMIDSFKAIVYLLDNEIDFNSIDGRKVRLIIFFAIPEKGGGNYMKVLSKVSEFLRNPDKRSLVFSASDSNELYRIFRRIEDEIEAK